MVAFIGIVAQHAANGLTPIEALKAHLASPTTANFATNVRLLPFPVTQLSPKLISTS